MSRMILIQAEFLLLKHQIYELNLFFDLQLYLCDVTMMLLRIQSILYFNVIA